MTLLLVFNGKLKLKNLTINWNVLMKINHFGVSKAKVGFMFNYQV
jgi:hypothetical protein